MGQRDMGSKDVRLVPDPFYMRVIDEGLLRQVTISRKARPYFTSGLFGQLTVEIKLLVYCHADSGVVLRLPSPSLSPPR